MRRMQRVGTQPLGSTLAKHHCVYVPLLHTCMCFYNSLICSIARNLCACAEQWLQACLQPSCACLIMRMINAIMRMIECGRAGKKHASNACWSLECQAP